MQIAKVTTENALSGAREIASLNDVATRPPRCSCPGMPRAPVAGKRECASRRFAQSRRARVERRAVASARSSDWKDATKNVSPDHGLEPSSRICSRSSEQQDVTKKHTPGRRFSVEIPLPSNIQLNCARSLLYGSALVSGGDYL
jgi:hypothetical protein